MAQPKIFKNINDQVSAVDPNGDTMKGAIRFNEGRGQLNAYSWDDGTTYVELYAKKNSDNKRTILQLNSSPDENDNSAIRLLFRDANGTVTGLSNLYGEHFKPTPSDINAFGFIKNLPANTDMNTILQTGSYYVNGTNAATITNAPFQVAGHFLVFNNDNAGIRVIQIYTRTNNASTASKGNKLFYRVINTSIEEEANRFGAWKEFAVFDEVLPLTGGRMTGSIIMDNESNFQGYMPRKNPDGGGWAYAPFNIRDKANTIFMNLGVYGSQNNLAYIYLGSGDWNATNNVRIYPSGTLSVASGVTDYSGNRCRNIAAGTSGSPVGNGDMFVKY